VRVFGSLARRTAAFAARVLYMSVVSTTPTQWRMWKHEGVSCKSVSVQQERERCVDHTSEDQKEEEEETSAEF
jgi:hypothetical protein